MPKVEILADLKLDPRQLARIELHSFQNVMTVILGELQFMGTVLGDKSALAGSMAIANEFLRAITDLDKAGALARDWDGHEALILADIERALALHPPGPEHRSLFDESISNLKRIFGVIRIRVEELLARLKAPGQWEAVRTGEVEARLRQVLDAIAENSRGRYGIVFDPARQGPNDYLVKIKILGGTAGEIRLPPVLLDTLRDLTANARKYSAPGAVIESYLIENQAGLNLVVSDTGRGIPEEEIEKVVGFGVRGSNTTPEETKGGGYGLTKACLVCKKHGGRMWIESELDVGTTVRIFIPRPQGPAE
ncbi:MAG: ATP-binding protein [Proteobacteria bacterium]|nr:ATP-binding protein [Pseudomonadota bacterium]